MEKQELYKKALEEIKKEIKGLGSNDLIAKMSTASAVLKDTFNYYLWCGFYFVEEPEMIVGPYEGRVACAKIGYGGVCGKAANSKETIVVPNVHKFPGHIVCDERSKSEIVVPLFSSNGEAVAVLDVDSDKLNAFDDIDKKFLENIAGELMKE